MYVLSLSAVSSSLMLCVRYISIPKLDLKPMAVKSEGKETVGLKTLWFHSWLKMLPSYCLSLFDDLIYAYNMFKKKSPPTLSKSPTNFILFFKTILSPDNVAYVQCLLLENGKSDWGPQSRECNPCAAPSSGEWEVWLGPHHWGGELSPSSSTHGLQ